MNKFLAVNGYQMVELPDGSVFRLNDVRQVEANYYGPYREGVPYTRHSTIQCYTVHLEGNQQVIDLTPAEYAQLSQWLRCRRT